MSILGEKLKQKRKEERLSLDKLSEKTGISKGYLWELENRDNRNPSIEKLTMLANALNTSIDFFLYNDSDDDQEEMKAIYRKFNKLSDNDKKVMKDMLDRLGDDD